MSRTGPLFLIIIFKRARENTFVQFKLENNRFETINFFKLVFRTFLLYLDTVDLRV